MANTNSQARRIPDFDSSVMLRDPAAAAITATTAEVGKTLNRLTAAYWDNGELPVGDFGVQFHITAMDRTTNDETYQFAVEVSSDLAFTLPVNVGQTPVLTSGGYIEVQLSGEDIQERVTGAAFIRVRAILGGTTPSTQYGAFLFHDAR